jgi:hypothetical protein
MGNLGKRGEGDPLVGSDTCDKSPKSAEFLTNPTQRGGFPPEIALQPRRHWLLSKRLLSHVSGLNSSGVPPIRALGNSRQHAHGKRGHATQDTFNNSSTTRGANGT